MKGARMAFYQTCLRCHLLQFPNVQDFPAFDRSNIIFVECEHCNCPTLCSHTFDFESCVIFIAMHDRSYVTLFLSEA
jgi:phage terminase large subunit GpA-like protein